jgi:hypothetical protein
MRAVVAAVAAVVLAVAVAVVAGACQDNKSSTGLRLTPTEYKDRVNRICADAANLTSTISPPTIQSTTEDIGLYAAQLRQILGPHVRAIEQIPVPPAMRPDMLRINDLFNSLLRNLSDEIDGGRANDPQKVLDASNRIKDLQSRLSTQVNAIGLYSCASS